MVDDRKNAPIDQSKKPIFAWRAADRKMHDRSREWYSAVIGISLLLIILLAWQALWTGVALVVCATILLLIMSRLKPKQIECAIYDEGVVVDGETALFKEFKSFWINYSDVIKIKLQRIGRIAGQAEMPLGENDPEPIRTFLSKHLPEEADKGEDIVDTVNRWIKF